jgi:hypothetical protein
MMGALGIGSSQLGQSNPWGFSPLYGQGAGTYPFTQHTQQYTQPLQYAPFGYGGVGQPYGGPTAQFGLAQQIQQLLHVLPNQLQQLQQVQQHQHNIQQQQLHQLQQLFQIVPQQIQQLQQLVQLLPQQLQQIQQLVQFVPQQIAQLQQQLLTQQTPLGASTGLATGFSQPFGSPFPFSGQGVQPLLQGQPFGVPSPLGQVM